MTDVQENIKNFNRVVGSLLVVLYESFPKAINLNPSNIGKLVSVLLQQKHRLKK